VTCPLIRYHPAIIAQAAATAASMMPGRFFLGIGTGERLNEHILGDYFPEINIRQEMLEEAVEIFHKLWQGDMTSYYGNYYTVENAQIFNLPKQTLPVYMAAGGEESAKIAGKIADGLIDTSPDKKLVKTFENAGGKGKPKYAQLSLCYAQDEKQALKTAYEIWPTSALPGNLGSELAIPKSYEAASKLVTEDMMAKLLVYGPDPKKYIQRIHEYIDAGFDHIALHQIGPEQDQFIEFARKNILPEFKKS
jgi:G6PDH family F420-dependent oxidoreductase